jgi:hypothetical protein
MMPGGSVAGFYAWFCVGPAVIAIYCLAQSYRDFRSRHYFMAVAGVVCALPLLGIATLFLVGPLLHPLQK